jgi:hypothetical protein
MGATGRAGTGYLSGAPEFTNDLNGVCVAQSLDCCVVLCSPLFVLFLIFFSFGHVCPLIYGF